MYRTLPGFFFASATSSAIDLTLKLVVVAMMKDGKMSIRATDTTSFSKSILSFFLNRIGVIALVETLPIISV